ncbi:MAG TPA: GNAT family N-acetyltransferase [Streptosporangiaceae bacterium]|nr:GNAT family N-acetyltransferase [Streptosporangiaceae bacterium]
MRIRGYRSGDLRDLYRICRLTGNGGGDATALYRDPDLLGHIYAAPYGALEPTLAFVAEDQAGVGGYCLGALDTRAFERRMDAGWWPPLRLRYPEPDPADRDRWTPDELAAHLIHHPWRLDEDLVASYPSHLHINLLPRLQGRGNGRRLMAAQLAALRERGSSGVHFHVNANNRRAVGFYRHLGFSELHADGTRHIFGMRLAGLQPEPGPAGSASR